LETAVNLELEEIEGTPEFAGLELEELLPGADNESDNLESASLLEMEELFLEIDGRIQN